MEVLPQFAQNVLAQQVHTYGYYAHSIGRDSAKEGVVVGKAMHAIGAACVFTLVPVAPLYYVERADGEWRGVFQEDAQKRNLVLPHYDLLSVTAREYRYSEGDFDKIARALREVPPKYLKPMQLSPHHMWHVALQNKIKDGGTFFERALAEYRRIFNEEKARRTASKRSAKP